MLAAPQPLRPVSASLDVDFKLIERSSARLARLDRPPSTRSYASDAESVTSTIYGFNLNGRGRVNRRPHHSTFKAAARFLSKTCSDRQRLACVCAVVLLFKSAVSLGSYSGQNAPPMFGDLEAQRHWLSLTLHKPLSEWYYYNLEYWGLDYPPLTAYHSWTLARILNLLGGQGVVALRGVHPMADDATIKAWMRSSVLATEVLLWFPAVYLWTRHALPQSGGAIKRSGRTKLVALLTILLQPAIILVDNGHFQYNTVMLGLTLLAVACFQTGRDVWGCVCFVAALAFKQMSLYYAPAIFAYLLGKCLWLGLSDGLNLFMSISTVTLASFVFLFLPFLGSLDQVYQVIHRIFPFARGLYEDKVANFWCALNVAVKLRNLASIPTLAKLSLLATLLAILPSVALTLYLSYKLSSPNNASAGKRPLPPTASLLNFSLFSCSMAFFLFSFQVHEKSILLPLLPLTLIMADKEPPSADWAWAILVNNVAVFSMWPLLKKDGLGTQYLVLAFLWNYLLGYNPLKLPSTPIKGLSVATYAAIAFLHIAELTRPPPSRFPDLFIVLNLTLSAGVFFLSYLWSLLRLAEHAWAVGGLYGQSDPAPPKAPPTPTVRPEIRSPPGSAAIDRVTSPLRRSFMMERVSTESLRQRYHG